MVVGWTRAAFGPGGLFAIDRGRFFVKAEAAAAACLVFKPLDVPSFLLCFAKIAWGDNLCEFPSDWMMAMLLRFDSVGFFTFDTTGSFAFFLLPRRELGSLIGATFFLDTF